jgi:hypothetical protein
VKGIIKDTSALNMEKKDPKLPQKPDDKHVCSFLLAARCCFKRVKVLGLSEGLRIADCGRLCYFYPVDFRSECSRVILMILVSGGKNGGEEYFVNG